MFSERVSARGREHGSGGVRRRLRRLPEQPGSQGLGAGGRRDPQRVVVKGGLLPFSYLISEVSIENLEES